MFHSQPKMASQVMCRFRRGPATVDDEKFAHMVIEERAPTHSCHEREKVQGKNLLYSPKSNFSCTSITDGCWDLFKILAFKKWTEGFPSVNITPSRKFMQGFDCLVHGCFVLAPCKTHQMRKMLWLVNRRKPYTGHFLPFDQGML